MGFRVLLQPVVCCLFYRLFGMRLTNRSEYALLALVYLARKTPGVMTHGDEIAERQKIPKRFLQQILHFLKQARLVKSGKGRAGGYELARKSADISLAEIVRLFEGPLAASRSASQHFYESTPIEHEKKVVQVLKEIRQHVSDVLEKLTLADIA